MATQHLTYIPHPPLYPNAQAVKKASYLAPFRLPSLLKTEIRPNASITSVATNTLSTLPSVKTDQPLHATRIHYLSSRHRHTQPIIFQSSALSASQEEMKKRVSELCNTNEILRKTYLSELPDPTHATFMNRRVYHPTLNARVVLWRGCTLDQLLKMAETRSAGNELPSETTLRPTEHEIIKHLGEQEPLPELTNSKVVAEGCATDSFLVVVRIGSKYLRSGNPLISGWVCRHSAPIEIIGWKEGRLSRTASSAAAAAS